MPFASQTASQAVHGLDPHGHCQAHVDDSPCRPTQNARQTRKPTRRGQLSRCPEPGRFPERAGFPRGQGGGDTGGAAEARPRRDACGASRAAACRARADLVGERIRSGRSRSSARSPATSAKSAGKRSPAANRVMSRPITGHGHGRQHLHREVNVRDSDGRSAPTPTTCREISSRGRSGWRARPSTPSRHRAAGSRSILDAQPRETLNPGLGRSRHAKPEVVPALRADDGALEDRRLAVRARPGPATVPAEGRPGAFRRSGFTCRPDPARPSRSRPGHACASPPRPSARPP